VELFFPHQGESGRGSHTDPAKAVCAGCDVRTECLTYALDNHIIYGTWGGVSERGRRGMRRVRRLAAAS